MGKLVSCRDGWGGGKGYMRSAGALQEFFIRN